MSLEAMDWVWNHSKSKGVGRLVMLALADKAMPSATDCKAYGSYRFLSQRANCTQGAITEALDSLYALGELELLPEKGPQGAATYRLLQAIGHVRPVRTNRSAQRSDSSATDKNESLGSAEQQVHGSAERLSVRSHGSPEHTTTYSPRTTTSAPSDPSATPPPKGGGGGLQQEAETFLQSLPDPWTAGRSTARQLAPLLLEAITEQGWQLDTTLIAKLTENPGGIQRYPSVLKKRITDLPKRPTTKTRDSPTSRPGLPLHCGSEDCNPVTRMRTTDGPNGYPISGPCRDCHPDTIKDTAA